MCSNSMDCSCCCFFFSFLMRPLLKLFFFLLLLLTTSLQAFEYTFLMLMYCVHVYFGITIRGEHTYNCSLYCILHTVFSLGTRWTLALIVWERDCIHIYSILEYRSLLLPPTPPTTTTPPPPLLLLRPSSSPCIGSFCPRAQQHCVLSLSLYVYIDTDIHAYKIIVYDLVCASRAFPILQYGFIYILYSRFHIIPSTTRRRRRHPRTM